MKEINKTLIIGLGGTGQQVIREIKKRMFRTYGEVPKLVKFLSFDTDNEAYENTPFKYYYDGENRQTRQYNLARDEFFQIYVPPELDVIKNDPNCQNLNFEELEKIYNMASDIGANGFRVMGRSHFLYNATKIMKVLSETVRELRNAQLTGDEQAKGYYLSSQRLNVYIVTSLAGDTGSAVFMDFSRMLQHAGIETKTYLADDPTDKIFGLFFLPSFFAAKPNTQHIKINTYVALSELDYALGLNDERRYPAGCREIEDDWNIYGEYREYKPVRFSNVYLIDNRTKNGNIHTFSEAAACVASFVSTSIAADNTALESSFSNSQHIHSDVEGKTQAYSGLGFCEVRFDRQNLVKYLLNQQLCEILKYYKIGDAELDVDKIADAFIADNQLDEGTQGQFEGDEDTRVQFHELTDSIYRLEDERFSIPMARVEAGRGAAQQLENGKNNYLNRIQAEANQAIKEFALRKRTLLANLNQFLSDQQSKPGFGTFPDLAKRLKSSFSLMKAGLEDEIVRHNAQKSEIETFLKKTMTTVQENSSNGFLGIGSRLAEQRDAMNSYIARVEKKRTQSMPTLARLALEITRKTEAVKLYEEFINTIDKYYKEEIEEQEGKRWVRVSGSASESQALFDQLKWLVDNENSSYKPSKSAKNEAVYVDAYFKEYFATHPNKAFEFPESAREAIYKRIQKILVETEPVTNELLASLRELILESIPNDALIKDIKNSKLSLDQLFIECFGTADKIEDSHDMDTYPQLGLFGQLSTLFDYLWQYDDFCGGNSMPPELLCVVGVYDTSFHIFNRQNGYRQFLPDNQFYQFINLGDPDRIVFILQEIAIPAFKLRDAEMWRSEYEYKKDRFYAFSDKRLEGIDLLMPLKNENGDIAWAYGWMFGLIASIGGGVQIKPSADYLTRHPEAALGPDGYYDYFKIKCKKPFDIAVCYKQFMNDDDLANDIYQQVREKMVTDPIETIVSIAHWVNDGLIWTGRGKQRQCMTPAEIQVVQKEPMFLEKCFPRLCGKYVSIQYLDGKMVTQDSLGLLAVADEAYKAQGGRN